MNEMIDALPPLKFKDIYLQERLEIRKRREKQSYRDGEEEGDVAPQDCVGLALSGGGIRSATFCLGFLQELNKLKLLRIFDYLSTVSGGGYVAGWWSAWLSREEETARTKDECPFLKKKDIHNASSLIARITEGADPVSKELLDQMQSSKHGLDTYLLLAKHREDQSPCRELLEKLIEELNTYICKQVDPSLKELSAVAPAAMVVPELQEKKEKARLENQRLWANRLRLERAFPYELRDIFPPDEMIEPERRTSEDTDQGSDGSLCAWEDPIHHLRLFANYLTPRKGMLSADTWRAVSVITRNLTLTWLILLPLLITLMLLGQAYLLLNPATRNAFLCAGSSAPDILCRGHESISLVVTLAPLAVLLGWSVVMAIGWLICNRENSSPTDWIVQTVCLLALGALVASVVYSVPALSAKVVMLFGPPYLIVLIMWAAITTVFVLFIWHWGLHTRDISGSDNETQSRWKREVRRSRFSRAQAKLLVTTTVVAGVLLISWVSSHSLNTKSWSGYLTIPFAIVPLISAIGGSIFTALRATPTTGGDRLASREPSMVSRFVFAVTPGLVIVVLAGLGGIAANRLLRMLTGTYSDSVYALSVAAMLAIALCVALAVYEMKDVTWSKVRKRSLPQIFFIGLLIVNVSWGWQALAYSLLRDTHYPDDNLRLVFLLLPVSAFMAIIITAIVLGRVMSRADWKGMLFQRMEVGGKSLNKSQRRRRRAIAKRLTFFLRPVLGISLFTILTVIGLVIGQAIFTKTKASGVFGAVILSCVSIAGGLILFRLCLVRSQVGTGQNRFELKWFKDNALGKRPEGLWLLAALCLAVPVAFICFGHQLMKGNPDYHEHPGLFMLFPINLVVLLCVLILLRSLVIQKLANERIALVGWSKTLFDWAFARIPHADAHRARVMQLLAFVTLGATIIVDPVAHKLSGFSSNPIGAMGRANWILIGVVLFVNLPIFGVSLFQIPPSSDICPSLTFKNWKWPYGKVFLWTLAFISILLAFTAGQLLPNWLEHVSEVHLDKGLTPILLPGATGCFMLVIFEMFWGERDNRRSLWLITSAYLGFAIIFFMGLTAGDLRSWHVVLGLLAAVAVWVVALGWMVDPNAVSMHQFYKGRLVRAYLGASNIRRRRHGKKEITETVAGDDLLLKSLHNCERGGPYHLINTTLNLVGGRDLATAQRSASSFVLSQMHCGSFRTDYRTTQEYMSGQLSLGTAVAASGAAVSPNMGSKKPTAALAMLMTLLNVRLGYWAPTPNREASNLAQPRLWPFYLLREFFSQTNDVSTYCYLTDGGHFDNTGLYSLIERGCRYIVLVDCGADPRPSCFQDLGEAIRRCRIDFGTEIDLSLDPLISAEMQSERCYLVGKIHFSRDHIMALRKCYEDSANREDNVDELSGTIIYVKPAVVGRVTADVRQYAIENDSFPQQTTANQWFGEAQFESYRRLGQFCARSVFNTDAVKRLSKVVRLSTKQIEGVFRELQSVSGNTND